MHLMLSQLIEMSIDGDLEELKSVSSLVHIPKNINAIALTLHTYIC